LQTIDRKMIQSNISHSVELTFFVPCFNEENRICGTLENIRKAINGISITYEIIVVNDGSTDRSVEKVTVFINEHPEMEIRFCENFCNIGLSSSFVNAAFIARGKYFLVVWGDNVMPFESIQNLIRHIGKSDLIIPYFVDVPGKNLFRMLISKSYTQIVNFLNGYSLRYYNGGAIFLRYDIMRWAPNNIGFSGFFADLISQLLDEGVSYVEIPITCQHCEKDSINSIFTLQNILSTCHTFLNIFLRRLRKEFFMNSKRKLLQSRGAIQKREICQQSITETGKED